MMGNTITDGQTSPDYYVKVQQVSYGEDFSIFTDKMFAVVYLLSGEPTITVGEQSYSCATHDYLVLGQNEYAKVFAPESGPPCELNILYVSYALCDSIADGGVSIAQYFSAPGLPDYRRTTVAMANNQLIRALFAKFIVEQEMRPYASCDMQQSTVVIMCILVARNILTAKAPPKKGECNLVIDNIFIYISRHIHEEITLDRLSEDLFFSKYYISHEFKKKVGIPLHHYIITKKLQYAKGLLKMGMSSTDVYHRCGFGGYSHFLRSFKAEFGITPKQYSQSCAEACR